MGQRRKFWWIPASYAGRRLWVGRHQTYGLAVYEPEAQRGADSGRSANLFILKSDSVAKLRRPAEENSSRWLPLRYAEAEFAADEYMAWREDLRPRRKDAQQRSLLIRPPDTPRGTGPTSPDSWLRLANSRNPPHRRFWWIRSESSSSRWFWVGLHSDGKVGAAVHDPLIWTPRPRDTVLYLPTQHDVFKFASSPLRKRSTWSPHLSREDAHSLVEHEYLPWLAEVDFFQDLAEEGDKPLEWEDNNNSLEWFNKIKWWDK